MMQSSHGWRRAASRLIVGLSGTLFATSSAHASPSGQAADLVAVLAGDGLHGYGGSLSAALDALVDDGMVDSAAGASPPEGAARADLLRFLAAGSTMAVVVQGAAFGPALAEVAVALPEEAFIWIPGDAPTDPATVPTGLPNVSTIYADVSPAATVLGELVGDGRLAEVQRLGWTGSSEPSGDDGIFITSLIGAAELNSRSVVLTSRLSDAPADSTPTDEAFDVLLVSGRASSELTAPLRIEIAGSAGDDSEEPSSADDARRVVVGFHYEVALAEILAGYESGELGGTEHFLTLENGGLTLEATDPADAAVVRDALVDAGLAEPEDSSPPTTEGFTEPNDTAPAESEPEPTTPPATTTSPVPGRTTTSVRGTLPPDTGGPGTAGPTEPSTAPTTDGPGTTAGPTSTDPPSTTDGPTTSDPPTTEIELPTIPTVPPIVTEAPDTTAATFFA